MRKRVTIVYNEPVSSNYDTVGEEKAVLGVLEAVAAVHQALLELGYDVARLPLVIPLEQAEEKLKNLDTSLVFNLFEGFCGYPETEAFVPEVLSKAGIPFTGCPGPALKLALDKARVKAILKEAGIPTPDFQLLDPEKLNTFRLSYPCIVKPCAEDASHGISPESVVQTYLTLEKQVRFICSTYHGDALVEEFIDGREFNATVIGNSECTVLPISEIDYSLPAEMPRILDFAAKWEPDSLYFQNTKVVCPAKIRAEEQEHLSRTAKAAFRLTGCRCYARVDLRLDKIGQLNVIEVNPNPDISPGTGTARQAGAAGMDYTRLIEKIVELALEKSKQWASISAP